MRYAITSEAERETPREQWTSTACADSRWRRVHDARTGCYARCYSHTRRSLRAARRESTRRSARHAAPPHNAIAWQAGRTVRGLPTTRCFTLSVYEIEYCWCRVA
eukprot:1703592-Pleurochrysis_carterae.AAC.4